MSTRPRGIVLIVVAGILVLLALAAAAMLDMAVSLRLQADTGLDAASARLLARSGIEHASAKLYQSCSRPSQPSRGNQPDDWTYRDDLNVPLERAENPSYAQTEPYTDLGVPNGRFDAGVDPYMDVNANGRFDAWSGRLRGRSGMTGATFLLRIEPEDGKINVNDGYLDVDRHVNRDDVGKPWEGKRLPHCQDLGLRYASGVGIVFDPDPVTGAALAAANDTRSPEGLVTSHRRLADLIDELADVVGVDQPPWVGEEIILHRPPGGYASLKELEKTVGPAWAAMRGCFSVRGGSERIRYYRSMQTLPPATWDDSFSLQSWKDMLRGSHLRTPVNLAAAPVEVLQALAQGICVCQPGSVVPVSPTQMIQTPEARALAQGIVGRRPFGSWYEWFGWLDGNKTLFFPGSPLDQNDKVNAVEMDLNPDDLEAFHWSSFPAPDYPPDYSWLSYDLDRGASPKGDGGRFTRFPKLFEGRRFLDPPAGSWATGPVSSKSREVGRQFELANPALVAVAQQTGVTGPWGTYPVVLAQPGNFQVESMGRVGRLASAGMIASVAARRSLSSRHQSDFENLPPRFPYGGVQVAGRPAKDRIQTYPWFPIDSCPGVPADQKFLCPAFGTVRLMDRSPGPAGGNEVFYLPCWEEGQPMRPPAVSTSTREIFSDASRGKAFPKAYPGSLGILSLRGNAFPGQMSGGFEWGTGAGANPAHCPIYDGDGALRKGAVECFVLDGTSHQEWKIGQTHKIMLGLFPLVSGFVPNYASISTYHQGDQTTMAAQSVRSFVMPEPRLLTCCFSDPEGIQGYIDGSPDPGLHETYQAIAPDPMTNQQLSTASVDEFRMFSVPEPAQRIAARALRPRYWVPLDSGGITEQLDLERTPELLDRAAELREKLQTVPSFTSPLYTLPSLTAIKGVQWDGFVPRQLRQAVDAQPGAGPPLRVDLIVYPDAAGTGEKRVIRLPDDFWRTGGGSVDLDVQDVRSLRYRVWMDASAITGFNNATPVFDSISVAYASGRISAISE